MGIHDLVINGEFYDVEFKTNDKKPYTYWRMYELKGIKKISIYNTNSIRDILEVEDEIRRSFKKKT